MRKIFLLPFYIFLSINCFAQSYWRIQNERGEELLLTINNNPVNLTFEAHSRENALKDIVGTFMYMVAKTAGKIKYPELVHGGGKISFNADTTYFNGTIEYPDNSFVLKAKTYKNNFFGLLTDTKGRTRTLIGEKVDSDNPLRDYPSLINNTFSLVEKYFWDAKLLKSSDWLTYKSDVNGRSSKIQDDYELGLTMMWLGKKLNQVPHELRKVNKNDTNNPQQKSFSLKITGEHKAYLHLNNIPEGKDEVVQLFKAIQDKNVDTLLLDLRLGRRSLSLNAALMLASHLTSKPTDWGVYLTRKWSESETTIPKPSSYLSTLKNPLALSGIKNSVFNEKGFYLKLVPVLPVYKGKVYLLIDKSTSNVAEALAIFLKNEKIATLIGQKTAGSPLLTEAYELDKQYRITIPFAQFYDKDGKNYQGIGLEPDIVSDKPMEEMKNEK